MGMGTGFVEARLVQLYTTEPPSGQLSLAGVVMAATDPPADKTPPSLAEVKEAVRKLKGGKPAGTCNISAERLKARAEAMAHGLHAVQFAVSSAIPLGWKRSWLP